MNSKCDFYLGGKTRQKVSIRYEEIFGVCADCRNDDRICTG